MRHGLPIVCLLTAALLGGCGSSDPDAAYQGLDRNDFVYAVMRDAYLYYDEVPQLDTAAYADAEAVLAACVVGPPRDRWSYITTGTAFETYYDAGQYVGWGFTSAIDTDGWVRIAVVQPDSPADLAGMQRGDAITAIDGLDLTPPIDNAAFQAALGPSTIGFSATLSLRNGGIDRSVTIAKDVVTIAPVPSHTVIDHAGTPVGYLVFHDFIDTATSPFTAAIADFATAGVRDVVIDLRYNRGGSLRVTTACASLLHVDAAEPLAPAAIAGAAGTTPDLFCTLDYNDSGWTGDRQYYFAIRPDSLPLDRIIFLTGPNTASASELLINGLAPYHEVICIGSTTHGKPVGMNLFLHDATDTALVPLTFALTNVLGDGAYFDGIPPDATRSDDLDHALGDISETLLAEALSYIANGTFTATVTQVTPARDADPLYPSGLPRETGKH